MTSLNSMIKSSAAIVLVVSLVVQASAATFSAHRGLSMDIWQTWPGADQWADRGVLLPFPEWRRNIAKPELTKLAEAGFDFVRIPIDPAPFLSPKTEPFRDALFASIEETVRLVNDTGLKAIIDLHTYPQGSGDRIGTNEIQNDPDQLDRYLQLIRDVAMRLSGFDPGLVALELMNEPTIGCDGNGHRWAMMNRRLFAAARASATQLTLVLSGGCWADEDSLSAIDPGSIPDNNVIWTFHSYAPFVLTHQGASWVGGFISEVAGLPYPLDEISGSELSDRISQNGHRIDSSNRSDIPPGTRSYFESLMSEIETPAKLRSAIAMPFETVARWAERHDINPENILLGEFGMIRQEYGNGNIVPAKYRATYYRDIINIAEEHGFAWSLWGYGGAFGVVEEFEGRPAETDVLDMIRSLPR